MKLHHVGFWTTDIEKLERFYLDLFGGRIMDTFSEGDYRAKFLRLSNGLYLELMSKASLRDDLTDPSMLRIGYSHLSLEVETREKVDELTSAFEQYGCVFEKKQIAYEDGFYESAIIDPDGNIIEIAYIDREKNIGKF